MDNNLNESPMGGANNKPQTPPNNYLILSIVATLLCLPLGVMGIINSSKVDGLYAAGDYEAAQRYSNEAKKWSKYGIIGWGVFMVLYIILIVILGIGAAAVN